MLNDQFHAGEFNEFQWEHISYFALKGIKSNATPPASVDAYMRWLRLKSGPQVYQTVAHVNRYSDVRSLQRSVQKQRSRGTLPPKMHDGLNVNILESAEEILGTEVNASCGDGTRGSRYYGRVGIRLVGATPVSL